MDMETCPKCAIGLKKDKITDSIFPKVAYS